MRDVKDCLRERAACSERLSSFVRGFRSWCFGGRETVQRVEGGLAVSGHFAIREN